MNDNIMNERKLVILITNTFECLWFQSQECEGFTVYNKLIEKVLGMDDRGRDK